MEKTRIDVEQGFYKEVAELFDISYTFKPRVYRVNRWNNRDPGNGRFPGYGFVRMYNVQMIHVCLKKPCVVNKICSSVDEVLDLLKEVLIN